MTSRVLALFGPTAVGKTAMAHRAARELGGEVVVADPFQRYRGLEIAADSPGDEARAEVPYHLVGDLDLAQGSSAADFARRAHAVIDDVLDRGRVPIVAGGTGLYLRAACGQLDFPDAADPAVRAWAENEVDADIQGAGERLRAMDPAAAEHVDLRNPRRVARALEVAAIGSRRRTGQLWSSEARHPTLLVALLRPRPVLDRLISRRIRREIADGLIDELRRERGYPGVAREPLQIIGAREVAGLDAGTLPADDLPRLLEARTRRLARRQLAWLRRIAVDLEIDLGEAPTSDGLPTLLAAWERSPIP